MGSLLRTLRRFAQSIAPRAVASLRSMRSRRHSHRLERGWGLTVIDEAIVKVYGDTVRAGPFEGLRLPPSVHGGHVGPYLFGTYEEELHPWLEQLRRATLSSVVDIGSSIGYYAVGLARWFPELGVLAVDPDPWARRAVAATALANRVANVAVSGFLTPGELERRLGAGTLLICDCEGFERELFTAWRRESLEGVWAIVELHEPVVRETENIIRTKLADSHEIRSVEGRHRAAPDDAIAELGAPAAALAVIEARGLQKWLFLQPKGSKP